MVRRSVKTTNISKTQESDTSGRKYIEIPLPNISFLRNKSGVNLVLVGLLLVAAFALGTMYNRLQQLEGGTSVETATVQARLVSYATTLKLNKKQFQECLDKGKYKDSINNDLSEAQQVGATGTPATFVNGILISGAVPFEEFKKVIDLELAGEAQSRSGLIKQAYAQAIPQGADIVITPSPLPGKVSVGNGHLPLLGSEKAKVTVIEFSDFQCPFCKQMFTNALSQIKKEYIDSGKIKFYYRHLPLTSIHPNAMIAAEASECANEQGKFWEYHDMLFQTQDAWTTLPLQTTPSN